MPGREHVRADTPSLPIGADEVTIIDHVGAYATFPNLGKAVAPHAALEVRTGTGELVWRFDRDGKRPEQVISPQVATDMAMMMSKVVDEGTAKRAILDGIKAAGKTGTTNAYRDAWFIGFTGNYIAGVWYGNDDYTATNRMTGGSLPAQTWHDIMEYAHQGIELKSVPGLLGPQSPAARAMAEAKPGTVDGAQRPPILTKRGTEVLVRVERLMEDATRGLAVTPGAASGPQRGADLSRPGTFGISAERGEDQRISTRLGCRWFPFGNDASQFRVAAGLRAPVATPALGR